MNIYVLIAIDIILFIIFFIYMIFYVKDRVAYYMELKFSQMQGSCEQNKVYTHNRNSPINNKEVSVKKSLSLAEEARRLKQKGLSYLQIANRLGLSTGELELLLNISETR